MQREYRIFTWLFITAFCLIYLYLFITSGTYLLHHSHNPLDFLAFYTGAQLVSRSPTELYNLHSQLILQQQIDPLAKIHTGFLPFLNPPFVALAFEILVNFGLENAYIVFLGINVILIVLICFIAMQQLNKTKWYSILLLIIGIATFIPILITLLIGQLSIVLCIIFLLAWLSLKEGREFRTGFVLSLLLIKPHFLILPLLAMLVQRRINVIYGLMSGIVILVSISYFYIGWSGISTYSMLLTSFYKTGVGYNIDLMEQHSLQTLLLIIFHTQSPAVIRIPWIISIMCIILPTLFIWSKKFSASSPQFSFQFALLIIATLLTSPHTPIYDLSLLTIVSSLLLSQMNKFKHRQKVFLVVFIVLGYIISLIGYSLDILSHGQTQDSWIVFSVIYLVIFWLILLREFAGSKKLDIEY